MSYFDTIPPRPKVESTSEKSNSSTKMSYFDINPPRPKVESTSEKSNSSTKMSYFGITEGKKSPLKPNKPIETKKL